MTSKPSGPLPTAITVCRNPPGAVPGSNTLRLSDPMFEVTSRPAAAVTMCVPSCPVPWTQSTWPLARS